jgi:hypothetical protein
LEEVEEIFTSNVKPWKTKVNYSRAAKQERGDVESEKKVGEAEHIDIDFPEQSQGTEKAEGQFASQKI